MKPVEESTGIFSLPMSNNCLKNTSADSLFYNATRILRIFTYFEINKFDDFKQALILSTAVVLKMTDSV